MVTPTSRAQSLGYLVDEGADPDAPTATIVAPESGEGEGVAPVPSSGGVPQRGGQGPSRGDEDGDDLDGEDEMPDYRLLAKFTSQTASTSAARKSDDNGIGASDRSGLSTAMVGSHPSSSRIDNTAAPPSTAAAASSQTTSLPKRGAKDFEPTGFTAQGRALEASRTAMFEAISVERSTGSKSLSIAYWEPKLSRAIVTVARGSLFQSIGSSKRVRVRVDGSDEDLGDVGGAELDGTWKQGVWWPKTRARLELTPEETLYLVERGALECRLRVAANGTHRSHGLARAESTVQGDDAEVEGIDGQWVALSVQQVAAMVLFKDECTKERYQVYAYLKRLGYVVQRADIIEEARRAARSAVLAGLSATDRIPTGAGPALEAEGVIRDPDRPLRLVTLLDLCLYPVRRLFQLSGDALQLARRVAFGLVNWIRTVVQRVLGRSSRRSAGGATMAGQAPGTGLLGIGGRSWDSFDSVFSQLQIVPSSHDLPLARSKAPVTPTTKTATTVNTSEASGGGYRIFYYAWRPATHYKRTDPPLPEFRIAVAPARSVDVPSMAQWSALFSSVPLLNASGVHGTSGATSPTATTSLGEEDAAAAALDAEELRRAREQKRRNDEAYGRRAKLKMDEARRARAQRATEKQGGGQESGPAVETAVLERLLSLVPDWAAAAFARLLAVLRLVGAHLGDAFAHAPPGYARASSAAGKARGARGYGGTRGASSSAPYNVFAPLKAGRRSVVLAVVDHGTMSLLRFGETEFAAWRLAGQGTGSRRHGAGAGR